MRYAKIITILAVCCLFTGCFQIEGVHVLHDYGESDSGGYRITMNRATYALLTSDDGDSNILSNLQSWSRPKTRFDGDFVHLEDTSGRASMEHFYDTHACKQAPQGDFMDCRFAFNLPESAGEVPDWSIDWEVVVQSDMEVLSSNNQRVRREDGLNHLIWYFDGNRVSKANVDFTVRTPRAR